MINEHAMNVYAILMQTTAPATPRGGGGEFLLPGLILTMVIFYIVMGAGSRKEKKKRQEMLSRIAKGDRVMTIGGAVGTVVSVTNDEVVVKVDESANVKMTFIRSAIQRVLTEGEKPADMR